MAPSAGGPCPAWTITVCGPHVADRRTSQGGAPVTPLLMSTSANALLSLATHDASQHRHLHFFVSYMKDIAVYVCVLNGGLQC